MLRNATTAVSTASSSSILSGPKFLRERSPGSFVGLKEELVVLVRRRPFLCLRCQLLISGLLSRAAQKANLGVADETAIVTTGNQENKYHFI